MEHTKGDSLRNYKEYLHIARLEGTVLCPKIAKCSSDAIKVAKKWRNRHGEKVTKPKGNKVDRYVPVIIAGNTVYLTEQQAKILKVAAGTVL